MTVPFGKIAEGFDYVRVLLIEGLPTTGEQTYLVARSDRNGAIAV